MVNTSLKVGNISYGISKTLAQPPSGHRLNIFLKSLSVPIAPCGPPFTRKFEASHVSAGVYVTTRVIVTAGELRKARRAAQQEGVTLLDIR